VWVFGCGGFQFAGTGDGENHVEFAGTGGVFGEDLWFERERVVAAGVVGAVGAPVEVVRDFVGAGIRFGVFFVLLWGGWWLVAD
jgi:hypothetical protein